MQIEDYIDLCKKPYLKIWCGARGIGGEVYGARNIKIQTKLNTYIMMKKIKN